MPAPETRSQILHPASPGRQRSRGEGLAGGREGHLAEVGGTGAGHEGVRVCRGGAEETQYIQQAMRPSVQK